MNSTRRMTRTPLLLVGGTAMALVLAGCGSSDHSSSTASHGSPSASSSSTSSFGPAAAGPHNAADVAFATDMVPHHAQAVEMANMALDTTSNAEIKTLAQAIQGAQDPEIRIMSGWLQGWGAKVPTSGAGHSMGGMSGVGGTGMMSADQMAELDKAEGATFDRLWVEMMTEHHTGAIAMAKTELADGDNAEAKALAQTIISAQTAEVATLNGLAKTLPQK